ncbi:hypothetical protein P0R31_38595 [Bradyrhizobium yuanmingense]|uniref:hypothetical protein n=1 Tax=Bradyrhizobium yuanmingense TaxID=108015 RepID=UPI0023B917BA|nr:hypothetical protein [Bradyrhizobium yuanmingense]MDF0523128.1 hypothetical protein [Bradyrhizobium yuanmingense]
MRFDPQLRARTPELRESVSQFTQHLIAEENKLGLRSRARKDEDRGKFAIAVEAVACNLLMQGLLREDAALAIPLDNNMMWGANRYPNPVYGQHFLGLLDLLERLKFLKRVTTGYRFSKTAKAPSLYKEIDDLGKRFPTVTPASFRREQEPEILILKSGRVDDGNATLISYSESQKTRTLRRQVQRINSWLLDADIELTGTRAAARLGKEGEVIASYRRTLHRTFNNKSWQQGGRLSGGFWMTMPRTDRFRQIRMDGKPVADVDYQQLFPRLAYVRARAPQPTADLYDLMGDGTGRDGWKLLLNALLFTRGPLRRWPRDCSALLPQLNLKQALVLLEQKHEPIAHLFGTSIGFELMFLESELLISVVTHLFESGIAALPLHDAVLVAEPNAEAAKAAMKRAFCAGSANSRASVKIEFGSGK